ncbi:hypothetical protein [Methanobrevibacter sp.]|uniref:hypothetical protein n=1 Tax=Methanobrevibacter sp. TaxID=66852 RepID=UPI00386F1B9C
MEDSEKIYGNGLKLKNALDNDVEDLYITSRFPPLDDISGIVFSKRIIKLNKKVDVVFSNFNGEKDFEFEKVINNFIDKKYIIDGNYMHSTSDGINFFRKEAMRKLNESNKKYKTVVSRSWTLESHFLALDYKLQHPDVTWIAEFSDPLRYDINHILRMPTFSCDEEYFDNLNIRIREINQQVFADDIEKYWPEIKSGDNLYFLAEYLPFLFADVVRFTNYNQREAMLNEFPVDIKDFVIEKSEVSRHPTLDEEYYFLKESNYNVDDDYLNFAYFGTYLGKRHLEFLFKCLEDLNEEISNKIRLHLFVPNPEVFKSSLTNQKNIVVRQKVPFLEFLNLTTKMDVLIVNDLLTEGVFEVNPFLPSKLSDYIGSKKDIWVVCEKNSSMDKFSCKYKSYVDDFDSSRNVFENILNDKLGDCGTVFKEIVDSEKYYQNRLTDLNNALDELYKQRLYWVKRTRLADRDVGLLKKDVGQKDKDISSLTAERNSLVSERDSLIEDVRSRDSSISSLTAEKNSLVSERDSLIEEINNNKRELNSLREDFVELHDVAKISFDYLAVKDDIISDKDNELDYYKNHGSSIKNWVLTPVEYSYLLLKSPNDELKLNYNLFKLLKHCNWFSRGYYLNNNKDLSKSWTNILSPELHYVCHGIDEDRLPNRETSFNLDKKELLRKLKYIKKMK